MGITKVERQKAKELVGYFLTGKLDKLIKLEKAKQAYNIRSISIDRKVMNGPSITININGDCDNKIKVIEQVRHILDITLSIIDKDQLEIMKLMHLEGKNDKEISEIFGCSDRLIRKMQRETLDQVVKLLGMNIKVKLPVE